jgi:hypothetical protein
MVSSIWIGHENLQFFWFCLAVASPCHFIWRNGPGFVLAICAEEPFRVSSRTWISSADLCEIYTFVVSPAVVQ